MRTTLAIADLPGNLLGLVRGGRVLIDRDAAGHGWFVDPTPETDEEFARPAGHAVAPEAIERVDLLTAVMHEFGHVLGLDHDDLDAPEELMHDELQAGIRRLPVNLILDEYFAQL